MGGREEYGALGLALARLAAETGPLILEIARAGAEIRAKSDDSPVTQADMLAEEAILVGLSKILPGVPVLAEESAAAGKLPALDGPLLVVDPLDGTREFIAGRPEYTINIGLLEAGRPVLGIIHAPALGRTYYGALACGAYCAGHGIGAVPALSEFAAINTRARPARPVALTSYSHADATTTAFLHDLGGHDERRLGSALKFAILAEGAADIYPRFVPTMEWDTAAGHALVEAAGGAVLTPEGAPLAYLKSDAGFRNGPFIAWGRRPD